MMTNKYAFVGMSVMFCLLPTLINADVYLNESWGGGIGDWNSSNYIVNGGGIVSTLSRSPSHSLQLYDPSDSAEHKLGLPVNYSNFFNIDFSIYMTIESGNTDDIFELTCDGSSDFSNGIGGYVDGENFTFYDMDTFETIASNFTALNNTWNNFSMLISLLSFNTSKRTIITIYDPELPVAFFNAVNFTADCTSENLKIWFFSPMTNNQNYYDDICTRDGLDNCDFNDTDSSSPGMEGIPTATFNITDSCCPISTFYCINNITLVQLWNTSKGISWALEDCLYGCDNVTKTCSPDPFTQNVYYIGMFLISCFVLIAIWKWA